MANVLTDLRVALVAELATAFPNATILSGARSAPTRDKDVIAVFSPGIAEWGPDVDLAQPQMLVRYWKKQSKQLQTSRVRDPAPLEEAAIELAKALQPKQGTIISSEGFISYRVAEVEIDYDDEWGVQARLVVFSLNPAVRQVA